MKGYSFFREKEQIFKKEYRVNKRHEYNRKLMIESINSKKVNLEVIGVDLSISGIGFISNEKFKINDILEIAFNYNKVTIPAMFKVQHVSVYDLGFYIGGQFIALQDMYRDVLRDLV